MIFMVALIDHTRIMCSMSTEYTFDENVVSDLYKEAYNSRPRESFWESWDMASDRQKQAIWDSLIEASDAENEREELIRQQAIVDLEDRIKFMQSTIVGATREDCIRYLHDVYKTNGDIEYLEFNLSVPYGYLSGKKVGWL